MTPWTLIKSFVQKKKTPDCPPSTFPVELSTEEIALLNYVLEKKLTMVSPMRLAATLMACKHVASRGIEGAFVECGVWRGGNALVAAASFKMYGQDRDIYLFDTFSGMTKPTSVDTQISDGSLAISEFSRNQRDNHNDWCYASLEDVKNSFAEAELLGDNIKFVRGDVMKTLDDNTCLPKCISLLRLDTDWYESTKKELEILYPRLSMGGVLLIDDYGFWSGSKKATDEYFASAGNRPFLQFSDHEGRAGVKF